MQRWKKLDTSIWGGFCGLLYIILMAVFILVMADDNIGLTRLSRTYGVTIVTFCLSEYLFLYVYGRFDLGRRKSKPIIHSLVLATICTDIVTYLQVMIMRTTGTYANEFRLRNIENLFIMIIIQIVIIYFYVYFGQFLYFKTHKPERCAIITSSQESLEQIVRAVKKHRKQFAIEAVLDYRMNGIKQAIKDMDTVILYDVPPKKKARIMQHCYEYNVNVYFNPNISNMIEYNARKYFMNDTFLFNKNVKRMTFTQRVLKRGMDIGLSLVGGILTAPVWITAMILIKIEDGGPVIFKQERATIHGRPFMVYKLRTMVTDAKIKSAKTNDDRITKVGKFLRRTRIDEIPQLWNVLKGEMSVVGPRPEMIKNVRRYTKQIPEFEYRLRMKAGLTGYAQIEGKYNTLPKDKLMMDMMYMEQFSILHDISLILQTIVVLLKADSTEGFKERKDSGYVFHAWKKEE